MASAFELNKEEYKHNFNKEDHTYIVSLKSGIAHDFKIDHPGALPVNFISLLVEERFIQQTSSFNLFTDPRHTGTALHLLFSISHLILNTTS